MRGEPIVRSGAPRDGTRGPARVAATGEPDASPRTDLLVVGLLACGVRLAHLLAVWDDPFVSQPILDARYYLSFAGRCLDGDLFGAEIYRGSPLTGYFVTLLQALFGRSPQVVVMAQVVLGGATASLVTRVGGRLGGRLCGWIAGLIYALCWPAVLYTTVIVPATLAIFLALLALDQAVDAELRRSTGAAVTARSRLLWLGSILALATLARERYALFALALLVWWAWRGIPRTRLLVGLGGPLLLALAVTTLNNALASGDLLPYSANGGINFYIGNGPSANGRFRPPAGFRRGRDQMYEDAAATAREAAGHPLSPAGVERYWYARTMKQIVSDPIRALATLGLKLSHLSGHREGWDVIYGDPIRRESLPLRLCLFGMTLVGSLGWIGLLRTRRLPGVAPLWLLLASQVVFMLIFFASSRFRLGLLPVLALGAGLLASDLRASLGDRRRSILTLLGVAGTAAAILAPLPGRERSTGMEATWHANRALTAIMSNAMTEAGREARAALAIDPRNVSAHIYLGRVLLEQAALDEAEQQFLTARRIRPHDPRTLVSLGVVALDRGDREAADEWFRAVLEVDPDNGKANYERAVYLLAHGDRSAARRHALRIADQPRYRERLRRLGLP